MQSQIENRKSQIDPLPAIEDGDIFVAHDASRGKKPDNDRVVEDDGIILTPDFSPAKFFRDSVSTGTRVPRPRVVGYKYAVVFDDWKPTYARTSRSQRPKRHNRRQILLQERRPTRQKLTATESTVFIYNPTGQLVAEYATQIDGDGWAVKGQETTQNLGQAEIVRPATYQMWSNVLKSPLTEISATGTKLKTKVFAGGAVVAEQMVLASNLVQWISADPVTGSSVRLAKNGAFDNYQRTEFEPMGQEVLPFEPPDEVPEPSNANGVYSAEEPEWQCRTATATGKSFFDQPTHCQRAQMERASVWLGEVFADPTENNVRRIELVDSQIPSNDFPASDKALAQAITSTSKLPDKRPGQKRNNAGLKPRWEVNIQISADPIEFNNAEFGGDEPQLIKRVFFRDSPCSRMAARAGEVFRKYFEIYKRNPGGVNEVGNADALILGKFDQEFTSHYLGTNINGLTKAWRLSRYGGRVAGFSVQIEDLGQSDFQSSFLDGVAKRKAGFSSFKSRYVLPENNFDADQVHHFVGYLSMGINDQFWVMNKHMQSDNPSPEDISMKNRMGEVNQGDVNLGNAAYDVGQELRIHPDRLWDLEGWIKREICEGYYAFF